MLENFDAACDEQQLVQGMAEKLPQDTMKYFLEYPMEPAVGSQIR